MVSDTQEKITDPQLLVLSGAALPVQVSPVVLYAAAGIVAGAIVAITIKSMMKRRKK